MTDRLTEKIGIFMMERRESARQREHILDILRNNGYRNETFESEFTNDVNILGKPRKYHTTYKFGDMMITGRYALVPVQTKDTYNGDDSTRLVLVDRVRKKAKSVVHAGYRGIDYHGKCKIKPLVLTDKDGKLLISYAMVLHADWRNPVKVSNNIWEDYFFRHVEHGLIEVPKELEARQ